MQKRLKAQETINNKMVEMMKKLAESGQIRITDDMKQLYQAQQDLQKVQEEEANRKVRSRSREPDSRKAEEEPAPPKKSAELPANWKFKEDKKPAEATAQKNEPVTAPKTVTDTEGAGIVAEGWTAPVENTMIHGKAALVRTTVTEAKTWLMEFAQTEVPQAVLTSKPLLDATRPSKKVKIPVRTDQGVRSKELWLTQMTTRLGIEEVRYEPGGVTIAAPGATVEGMQENTTVVTMHLWEHFVTEHEWKMCITVTGWKVAKRWFDLCGLQGYWDNPLKHTFQVTPHPVGSRRMSVAVRVLTTGLPKIKKKASVGGMFVWVPDPTPPPGLQSPRTRVYWEPTIPTKESLAAARARMVTIPQEKVQGLIIKQDGKTMGVQVTPDYYVTYLTELHGAEETNEILFRENAKPYIVHQVPHQIGGPRLQELLGSAGWGHVKVLTGRPATGGKSWMVLAADDPPSRRIGFTQRPGAPTLRAWEENAELIVADKEQRERRERKVMVPTKAALSRKNVPQPDWADEWKLQGKTKAKWETTFTDAIKVKPGNGAQQGGVPVTQAVKEETHDGDGDVGMEEGTGTSGTGTTTSPIKGKGGGATVDPPPPSLAALASNPSNFTEYLETREKTMMDAMRKIIKEMQGDITRDLKKDLVDKK